MHELSVCQALIEQVERVARDNDALRVVSIVITVGPLSGVEPQLLEHAYPLAAAGTIAENASLVVETVPVTVRCRTCGAETERARTASCAAPVVTGRRMSPAARR